jgi:hypothetical protein
MGTASSRLILLGLAATATGGRESHEDLERVIAVEQLARNNQELRSRETEGYSIHHPLKTSLQSSVSIDSK